MHDPDWQTTAEAASDWFARLHAPDCSDAQRAAFAQWLSANPAHQREYARMEALWQAMGPLESAYATQVSARPIRAPHPQRRRWSLAAAVAAIVVLAVGIVWQGDRFETPTEHHMTAIGQRNTLMLADGSTLELNTDTAVDVHYTRALRELRLMHGELFVHVAHDPERPLIVKAGAGEARALGTQFSVYLKPEAASVTVLEGKVQVTSGAAAAYRQVTELRAGERMAYAAQGSHSRPERVDVEALQAWRRGELLFRDQPLAQVVEEVERYHRVHVMVATPQLAAQRVSGVFKVQDLHAIVAAIATLLDAEARWPSSELVMLTESQRR